jgi:oligoendopeptidase F
MSNKYTLSPWSLSELFPAYDSPEMESAFEELDAKVVEFEGLRPKLTPEISSDDFMEMIKKLEAITYLAYHVYAFAGLSFSADTQDQAIQTFMGNVQQRFAELENRTLFFSLWWKGLKDRDAEHLMADTGDYHYWLEDMRNFKPHTLSEPEEKIVNIKNVTGARAMQTLYDTITNRYVFKIEDEGEVKELTRGELLVYVKNNNPDLRAAAYQELYRVFGDDGNILGQMYQSLVRDWGNEQVDLRKFGSPISARNLMNDIPDEVVDTLLDVCKKNASLFQRFFQLKARWLGVDRLRRYDVYAPVVESDRTFEYGEAVDMVLDSFERYEPKIAELARKVFDDGHLDSEVRKGKDSGAFCWSVTQDITPWVLLNYQGRPDDVATMAHELGHAIHAMLAEDHTLFTYGSSLPLAETASTFGEMLLVDRLLEEEKDENVRRDLLFRQMDDAYATIMRQAFFALFEREAHELVKGGASVEELADVYVANLKDQFGEAIELSEEFRWEWVSIPHIYHTPFYVYAYTFGQLLVLALYQQYKVEGDAFKPRYLKILSAGGSDAPERILTEAGIDIRSADFWQGGFDVLTDLVDQLEAIPVPE